MKKINLFICYDTIHFDNVCLENLAVSELYAACYYSTHFVMRLLSLFLFQIYPALPTVLRTVCVCVWH